MNRKNTASSLIDRDTVLLHVRALLAKDTYSHEDAARVNGMLSLADKMQTPSGAESRSQRTLESAGFWKRVKSRRDPGEMESRDLLESVLPDQTTATSVLVAQDYGSQLNVALKLYDRLFDPNVSWHINTFPGAPLPLPIFDDTANASSSIAEGAQSGAIDPSISVVVLAAAPMYRSGMVLISNDLLQDAAFDLEPILSAAFAVRLARGAGKDLVSALLASAPVAVTASGSSKNTGGAETGGTSIGTPDLIALRTSVNPAYRASGKCFWTMNDDTLAALDALLDKQGRPIFRPKYDEAGNRVLLGYPVAVCPSMPNIGLNAKPVAFGDFGRFAVRRSAPVVAMLHERFADYDKTAFRALMRCNGTLLVPSGGDAPVKLLQNAAS